MGVLKDTSIKSAVRFIRARAPSPIIRSSALGLRSSCSDHIYSISGNLKQVAWYKFLLLGIIPSLAMS